MPNTNDTNPKLAHKAEHLKDILPAFEAAIREQSKMIELSGGDPNDTRSISERLSHAIEQGKKAMTHAMFPGMLVKEAPSTRERIELNQGRHLYTYVTDTQEHRLFEKALRRGMASLDESERASFAPDDEIVIPPNVASRKTMYLNTDPTGGYLSSNQFASDVLRQMQNVSPVRQNVTVHPVSIGTGEALPVRTGIMVASRIAEQATRSAANEVNFGLEQIPAHEVYALSLVSRHLLADSEYPIAAELASAFADACAVLEGSEFVKGSGNGEMLGLDAAALPAANIVACADSSGHTVALDDVLKLIYKTVKSAYLPNARLLMNPKLYGTLRALKGTSGNGYLLNNDAPGTLFGLPVAFAPDMPDNATPAAGKAVMYLLHPSAYVVAVRQAITVVRLDQTIVNGLDLARSGLVGFYLSQRTGGQPVLQEAIARLVTA